MSLSTVLTKAQQRVDDDKTALNSGNAAAADLVVAQSILDSLAGVGDMAKAQGDAANARVAAAGATSTTTAAAIAQVRTALSAAPFNLTTNKEKKLTKAVTDAAYQADFDAVQTAKSTLATDTLAAADARIDTEASRQKVLARIKVLSQWVDVPESAIAATVPLLKQAPGNVAGGDLARAWWAINQASIYLALVDNAATAKAVTNAVKDLKKQADDYADKLDASITADGAVTVDATALAAAVKTLADKTKTTQADIIAVVQAGL
jgi:hypothetical protein